MKYSNDGLNVWYATPDAPAPLENASRTGASLTIGVSPPNEANQVSVHYRLDGGHARTLHTREAGTDYVRQVQYFRAKFPSFPEGRVVEYRPELTCGGRQAPSPATSTKYPSSFTLADPVPARVDPHVDPRRMPTSAQRFIPRMEFAAAVSCKFSKKLDIIGDTPLGLRVNYYLVDGRLSGPKLSGRVLQSGGDYLLIRRDGVGSVQVHAVFETPDGAMLGAEYYGFVDLGADGYQRALRGDVPPIAPLQLAPRFLTGDPRYAWINRCQFVGIGEGRVRDGTVDYDLFAVYSDPSPSP